MSDHWSPEEVEATVSDYLEMLAMELRGQSFNKAEHNRILLNRLNHRSRGAIERKHQNISAVLIDLGYPYIDGYKPLFNYQDLLYRVVAERFKMKTDLRLSVEAAVVQDVEMPPTVNDLLAIQVAPPIRAKDTPKFYDRVPLVREPVLRNYLEMESRNRSLGTAGEKLVVEYEHQRLWKAGKRDLANRIEHVSNTRGDHFGFDIQSFETDGRDRLIEVKTTRFGELTPFFASKNEVEVSAQREAEYQLYRLFKFTDQPRLFILPGSLRKSCSLDPIQFSVLPI